MTKAVNTTIKSKSVWGGVAGKIICACLVLAFVCGALAFTFYYALKGDVLLSCDEVTVIGSVDNGDNTVSVKLRVDKSGFSLSDVKVRKEGGKLYAKLYASVTPSDEYKMSSTGYYNVVFSFDETTKQIVQEGKGDDEITVVTLNHKN